MTLTIYHNPRCSKCRKTLGLIRNAGVTPTIVEYLDDPPPAERILELASWLGLPVQALLRADDPELKAARGLPELTDDAALAAWLTDNPKVLVRPIVVDEDARRAVIGRPPENVAKLLPA